LNSGWIYHQFSPRSKIASAFVRRKKKRESKGKTFTTITKYQENILVQNAIDLLNLPGLAVQDVRDQGLL